DVRAGLAAAARGVAHPRATWSPAEGGEDVLEAAAPTGTTGPEAGAATRHLADRVVLLALLLVGQHRVRLTDVLELLLGRRVTGVLVRVVLAGELAIGLLDVGIAGVGGDAEDGIEVLLEPVLASHRRCLPSSCWC